MSFNVSGYNISDIYIGDIRLDRIFVGETLVYDTKEPFYDYFGFEIDDPATTATVGFSRITTEGTSDHPVDLSKFEKFVEPVFYYSYDKSTWNRYSLGTSVSLGGANPSNVYFKGDNLKPWHDSYSEQYEGDYVPTTYQTDIRAVTGGSAVSAIGNVMALRYSNPKLEDPIPCDEAFSTLFFKCTSLTHAPTLPATTLASYCYFSMFYKCSSLTSIPALPALTVSGSAYGTMFDHAVKASSTNEAPCVYPYRIPKSGDGTAVSKSLDNMFWSVDESSTYTPSINTTFYVSVPERV